MWAVINCCQWWWWCFGDDDALFGWSNLGTILTYRSVQLAFQMLDYW
jgi:hypothetical protein